MISSYRMASVIDYKMAKKKTFKGNCDKIMSRIKSKQMVTVLIFLVFFLAFSPADLIFLPDALVLSKMNLPVVKRTVILKLAAPLSHQRVLRRKAD